MRDVHLTRHIRQCLFKSMKNRRIIVVVCSRTPFKVFYPIVRRIQVQMIYFWQIIRVLDKCVCDQPMNFNAMMFDAVSNVYTSINSRSSCWNFPQRCQICLARITSNAEYLSVHTNIVQISVFYTIIFANRSARADFLIHSENITIIITCCILYAIVIFKHIACNCTAMFIVFRRIQVNAQRNTQRPHIIVCRHSIANVN